MTEVDQRVVQMRFDDKDFDEKAKKTMKTLDKLSEKLSFSAVAQKSDAALEEVVDNVEKMANQAYTIVDRVIDKIRDSIANKLVDFIKSATIDQVANGWRKYSDMTTAVGTLLSQGHKIEKVNKTLEDLSYFADETSYSFNDMLSGIAKFTAAGVGLDDAKTALMGISNWAAQSGQNAEVASRVFGQLAQAMGTYMKKQDWMSVQTANMDTQEFRQTALDTAVALGTLKKVGENTYKSLRATTSKGAEAFTINSFVESLTQGAWMTSEVMVETYKKYATAVEKIKAIYDDSDEKTGTIIRQRQQINRDLIKQYSQIYKVTEETAQKELDKWSTLHKATQEEIQNYAKLNKMTEEIADKKINAGYYNAVAEYSKRTRKSIQETEKDLEQWSEYVSEFSLKAFLNAQEARTFTDVINSVKESAASAWRTIYTSIFGDYNEAKVLWTDMAEGLIGLFTDRLYKISEIFEEWKKGGGRDQMWRGLYAFGYGISMAVENIRSAWDDLITDGESGVAVLDRISAKIEEAGFKFYGFVKALTENGFFTNIAEALHNIKYFIDQVFGALYDGVRDALPDGNFFLSLLIEFSSIIKEITSNFKLSDTAVDGLRRTFKGLFIILNHSKKTIVDILVKIVLPILNAVFSVLGNIIDVIVTITGTIGDIIEYFMPLNSETSGLVKILGVLTDIITTLIKLIGSGLSWALRKLVPIIGTVIGAVAGLIESIGNLFNNKKIKIGSDSKLVNGFKGLKDKILEAWAPLKDFSEIIDQYKDGKGLTNFLHLFADITDGIGNRLLLTLDATAGFLEIMSESKFGKALRVAVSVLRWVIRAGLWLFNNLFVPALKEIITELGLTIESVKSIIDERGILGLLDLIQEVFKTGIFGSLINTINLINGVIGSNGLGKLFNKGAKVLESISDYFNAAKLNQSADVLLKVVAALMLLYTLLALITFLPVENYDRMRKAMFEMAIALGMVVGAIFVISAAAALAGGNLIAMAAGFVGVAVAITTALWALNAMVEWMDKVKAEVIEAGLEKLQDILAVYAAFFIKTIAPVALIAGKSRADVGGVGIAMAGLAASIWLLVKALQGVDQIDPDAAQNVFEFLSGIYTVLALSTALLVKAASGKEVHGIAIAIASIGVSLAAIKMIYPLCKDVIKEKGIFEEGKEALLVFAGFMLAFSASMFFVTSGVHGLISGLASMLLFGWYINIISGKMIPLIEEVVEAIIRLGTMLNKANFSENGNWVAFAAIGAVIAIMVWTFTKNFRWIFELWGEIDPIAMIVICITIISTMILFVNRVVPAIKELYNMIKVNNAKFVPELILMLFMLFSPFFTLMLTFYLIMDKYTDMYNKLRKGKLLSINVGIVNRELNGAVSIFSSIMGSIIGIYAGIAAIIFMVSKVDFDQSKIDAVTNIFGMATIMILSFIVPLAAMWISLVKALSVSNLFDPNTINKKKFVLGSTENTLTAVVRAIANTIQSLALIMGIVFVAIGGVAIYLENNKFSMNIDNVMDMMRQMTLMFVGIIAAFAVLVLTIVKPLTSGAMASTLKNKSWLSSIASLASVAAAVGVAIAAIGLLIGKIALDAATLNKKQFNRFITSIWNLTGMIGILFAAFIVLIKVTSPSITNIKPSITKISDMLPMLATLAGIILTILSIGGVLLPAITKLQKMDINKIRTIFVGVIAMLMISLGAIAVMMSGSSNGIVRNWDGTLKGLNKFLDILKVAVAVVGPILAFALALSVISDVYTTISAIPKTTITRINEMIKTISILMGIMMGVAFIGGISKGFATGFILVAVSLGILAGAIWLVANAIVGLHKAFNGGMEDGLDEVKKTATKTGETATTTLASTVGSASPAKEFVKIGKFCDLGLAKGMNDNRKKVALASAKLGDTATGALEDNLGIASPSKVFYKEGRFIVAGLSEGMKSQKSSLEDTMGMLGDSIGNSLKDSLGDLSIDISDIWGGKNPEDVITEGIKNIDAKSLVGKIFGLSDEDDEELQKWIAELDAINKAAAEGGGIDAGTARRASELKNLISERQGKSIGQRFLENTFGTGDFWSAVKGVGEKLGISLGDGASSDSVISKLTEKFVGKGVDDPNSVLGKIASAVKSGDWSSVGESIGGKLGDTIGSAIGNTSMAKGLMKLGWKFNFISDEDYNAYLRSIGEITETQEELKNSVAATDWAALDQLPERYRKIAYQGFDTSGVLNIDKAIERVSNQVEEDIPKVMNLMKQTNLGGTYTSKVKELARKALIETEYSFEQIAKAVDDGFEAGWHTESGYIGDELVSGIDWLIYRVKQKLGIASPSKVFEKIAIQTVDGAIVGTKEEAPKLQSALEDMTDDQINTMSLAMQAMDEMASGTAVYTPKIVPTVDSASLNSSLNTVDSALRVDPAKVNSSLNVETDMNQLAQSQYAMAGAIDNLRNDILTALATGELVKVDVETHTDESNLFEYVVRQNRLKYNRTGINSMLT